MKTLLKMKVKLLVILSVIIIVMIPISLLLQPIDYNSTGYNSNLPNNLGEFRLKYQPEHKPEDGLKEIKPEDGLKEIKPEDGLKEIKPEDGLKEIPLSIQSYRKLNLPRPKISKNSDNDLIFTYHTLHVNVSMRMVKLDNQFEKDVENFKSNMKKFEINFTKLFLYWKEDIESSQGRNKKKMFTEFSKLLKDNNIVMLDNTKKSEIRFMSLCIVLFIAQNDSKISQEIQNSF